MIICINIFLVNLRLNIGYFDRCIPFEKMIVINIFQKLI